MTITLLIIAAIAAIMVWSFVSYRRNTPARKQSAEPANALQPAPQQEHELPQQYENSNITAMAKDPNWLFSHWNIPEESKNKFLQEFGQEAWEETSSVIRIHNETSRTYWDVPINEQTGSWYFHVGQPNHTFHLELGRLLQNNYFYALLSSNSVTMPAASVSDQIDPEWPPLEAVWQSVPSAKEELGGSSPEEHSYS